MVQISFPALTNAQVVSGGGESGQTVTAVNNTQNTYSVDDMVFMNYRTADIKAQSNIQSNYNDRRYIPFIFNNIFYFRDGYNGNLVRRDYNIDSNSWTDSFVSGMGSNSEYGGYPRNVLGDECLYFMQLRSATLAATNPNFNTFIVSKKYTKKLLTNIYYLGKNRALQLGSSYIKLVNFDIASNTVGDIIKQFYNTLEFSGAYYDLDRILCFTGNYNIDNLFLFDDSNTAEVVKDYYKALPNGTPIGVTGLYPGDFIILSAGSYEYNLFNSFGTLQLYKFDSDMNIVTADNLPETLNNLVGKTANCYYDGNSEILTIGTQDEVYAFKFNALTNNFDQIDIGFSAKDLNLNKLDGYYYGFKISKDLTMCEFYYCWQLDGNRQQKYNTVWLINDQKRGWTIVNNPNSSSISGKISEVNDDGTYKVSTVLPKELTLSISVTPDTDDITVDGAIQ